MGLFWDFLFSGFFQLKKHIKKAFWPCFFLGRGIDFIWRTRWLVDADTERLGTYIHRGVPYTAFQRGGRPLPSARVRRSEVRRRTRAEAPRCSAAPALGLADEPHHNGSGGTARTAALLIPSPPPHAWCMGCKVTRGAWVGHVWGTGPPPGRSAPGCP
jgi:hypothetical protein